MSYAPDPEFDDWVQRARDADILQVAESLGATLKKAGAREFSGPCPVCGGDDRFAVNTKDRVYICRGSGSNKGKDGGDAIAMVQHVRGVEFVAAVEIINGEPPPRGRSAETPDEDALRERAQERRQKANDRLAMQEQERREAMAKAQAMFNEGKSILGTHAHEYLKARGISVANDQLQDLRFVPSLAYWGFDRASDKTETHLGDFPAMIAAIRNVEGAIIGVHRTYLDPQRPIKLEPPGAKSKNKAKKVYQMQSGGAIWLGPMCDTIAIAEGIETGLAWYQLGVGPENVTVITSVSLNNLAGGATGTRPHPKVAKRTIQNGDPDPDKPGLILPDGVREVILLGDGDSDPYTTRALLLTAGHRFAGHGCKVSVHMAPEGMDWNDVWQAVQRGDTDMAA